MLEINDLDLLRQVMREELKSNGEKIVNETGEKLKTSEERVLDRTREEIKSSEERVLNQTREEIKSSEERVLNQTREELKLSEERTFHKISDTENLLLEEMDRVQGFLEKEIRQAKKDIEELQQYYKIQKLENDNTALLLKMIQDLQKDMDDLKKKIA